MALITAENLSLSYGTECVASGISFTLFASDRLVVVGENGSGKSTLVRTLCGLHTSFSGTLTFGEGAKGAIGYLPQRLSEPARFPATVEEVVREGLKQKTVFVRRADRERVRDALGAFGIADLKNRPFSSLSGGQRQRALLARARLAADKVLVLDEPVNGLDPVITHELYHHIRSLSREGIGVVLVTHDVRGALGFCTHVLHLKDDGALFCSVEEYQQSPAFFALVGEEERRA